MSTPYIEINMQEAVVVFIQYFACRRPPLDRSRSGASKRYPARFLYRARISGYRDLWGALQTFDPLGDILDGFTELLVINFAS